MDSSAHTAPVDSETVKETESVPTHKKPPTLLSQVTNGFVSPLSTQTISRGDPWIRQRTQPVLTQKELRKFESLPTEK
jgi:hypothetical protein